MIKFIFFLSFLLANNLIAQTFQAIYKVEQTVNYTDENGFSKVAATLLYDGFFFKKNSLYISYLKPKYLNNYPNGEIFINNAQGNSNSIIIPTDSVQQIDYISLDSFLWRYRIQSLPEGNISNFVREFEPNFRKWQILDEQKNINGLNCQRAKGYNNKAEVVYDVWFCTDILLDNNIKALIGLPGLLVEAHIVPLNQKYFLQSYQVGINLNDNIFWPREFHEPFKKMGKIFKQL